MHINRVAKVVKGGKRFGFAALVVVGDQQGQVGFGHGKAREVPEAIRKATEAARRALLRVPMRDKRTLHHDSQGRHGAGKSCPAVCASGNRHHCGRSDARRVFDDARRARRGRQVSRQLPIPYNMVRATFDALKAQENPRGVASRRGKKVSEIVARRRDSAVEATDATQEAGVRRRQEPGVMVRCCRVLLAAAFRGTM